MGSSLNTKVWRKGFDLVMFHSATEINVSDATALKPKIEL